MMYKKARVILLNPPTAGVATVILLSLGYLAASLRKEGHLVKIIDATAPFKPFTAGEIKREITEFQPHFIGATLTITHIVATYLFLKDLRRMGVPIVAGGPQANSLPEEAVENAVDIAAIGEGEKTIVELAEHFTGQKKLEKIAGLCYRNEKGGFSYTPCREQIKDIDTIPFPDFDDFPIKNYTGSEDVNSNPIFWSILASRGCPFNCIFCSSHNVFGRRVRIRSAQNVFDEIKGLVEKFGIENVTFQDDEILFSKERFLELCALILNSGLKIKMSMRTRVDKIDNEILSAAKKVGLTRISFGIESWTDDTLKKIKKGYTTSVIHKTFNVIDENKFPFVSFSNIIGFPWETEKHLREHLRQLRKIPESIAYFTNAKTPIPYPKTELYDRYNKEFDFTNWWLDSKKNPEKADSSEKPFFMFFAFMIESLYKRDIFWNYPRKIQKAIDRFSWKMFELFVRRHFRLHISILIILSCKISHAIWKISPRLEQMIFRHFFNNRILRLKESIEFISKH